ncbi:MAG: S-layer homology domain-containing protein [Oscillospiraceae bacterium]|nr:S-layer homology domain-containing protein [Oscillospiraceae bacterium]
MKRTISAGLVLVMLFGMVTVLAVGSQSDTLITKNYLEGAYNNSLLGDINKTLAGAEANPLSRLNDIQTNYTKLEYAPEFTPISLSRDRSLLLFQGTSFMLRSGTAAIYISDGTVINVSTGAVVPSGTELKRNERYFCTENTLATITAISTTSGFIDGYYSTPNTGREFLPPPREPFFTDIPRGHVAFNAVQWAHVNGIIDGENGRFMPLVNMNRAQFALVMYKYEGSPQVEAGEIFSDVRSNHPAHDAIKWAHTNRIVTGDNGRFAPNDNITRAQMVLMLNRYSRDKGFNRSANANALDRYTDRGQIPNAAVEAMRWAVTHGLVTGDGNRIVPNSNISRSQVILILYRYHNNLTR